MDGFPYTFTPEVAKKPIQISFNKVAAVVVVVVQKYSRQDLALQ
jgi:hypothetical protein